MTSPCCPTPNTGSTNHLSSPPSCMPCAGAQSPQRTPTALQAPFRSGIQIEDYQPDPVVRALSMPRTNLLIADDVGLGKTIEAVLVMQELMLRHRACTMLIVCPAGLTTPSRPSLSRMN